MPSPLEIPGQIASEGFVSAPIWRAKHTSVPLYDPQSTSEADIAALVEAISSAGRQTKEMIGNAEGDAIEILEFQLAVLEDDTFPNDASSLIMAGLNADLAWRETLNEEIAGYLESDDEYFHARAADLRDVHDRVLAALTGVEIQSIPPGVIYLDLDISPSLFLSHDWIGGGIALEAGSPTSHVAMLARQRGIPAIVNLGAVAAVDETEALLDSEKRALVLSPSEGEMATFLSAKSAFSKVSNDAQKFAERSAKTADGISIDVLVNIADPGETDAIPVAHVNGVGLMRTEFLYGRTQSLPSEEVQFAAYKKVLEWAGEKPVTIRTVDAGGDKPIPGFTEEETNPFLGCRGIRLALNKPDIFAVQIRALLRAGVYGNLKVMLPMVSVPEELSRAKSLFEQEANSLSSAGIACKMPLLGIMVEVPSVAIMPERFSEAAFFSIGSNDLTQYVLATSRDNGGLAYLANTDDPSVLNLIERVASCGKETGQNVSLCGDAGSNPELVPKLLKCGLRSLSVAAAKIGHVKAAISQVNLEADMSAKVSEH